MFLYIYFFHKKQLKNKLENIADYSRLQAESTNQIGHYSQNKLVTWIRQMKWWLTDMLLFNSWMEINKYCLASVKHLGNICCETCVVVRSNAVIVPYNYFGEKILHSFDEAITWSTTHTQWVSTVKLEVGWEVEPKCHSEVEPEFES